MMSFGAAAVIAATGSVKLHEPSGQTVIVAACAVRAKRAIELAEMAASTPAEGVRDEQKRLICIIGLLLEIALDAGHSEHTAKTSRCVLKKVNQPKSSIKVAVGQFGLRHVGPPHE